MELPFVLTFDIPHRKKYDVIKNAFFVILHTIPINLTTFYDRLEWVIQ